MDRSGVSVLLATASVIVSLRAIERPPCLITHYTKHDAEENYHVHHARFQSNCLQILQESDMGTSARMIFFDKLREPTCTLVAHLTNALTYKITSHIADPWAMHGHSMHFHHPIPAANMPVVDLHCNASAGDCSKVANYLLLSESDRCAC